LPDFENLAVEDVARRDPRWPLASCQEDLQRTAADKIFNEAFRLSRAGDLLVVVDDEPGIVRPALEVFAEDLCQDRGAAGRGRDGAKVLPQPNLASFDDDRRRAGDPERERGDVRG
jgi:hypothetical protein